MRSHAFSGFLFGLLLFTLPHCSGTFSDICEKEKDCEGGNDADIDACVEGARGAEEVASAYDCSDAFDKVVDCTVDRGVCKDGHFDSSACDAEQKALQSCQRAASGKGK
jgi:hypothetical protein